MSDQQMMSPLRTDRLLLRSQEVQDAVVFRQLWTERDDRVPAHRRITADDHPTGEEIAARIAGEEGRVSPRLLSVQRLGTDDIIGYCGLIFESTDAPEQPELAFELLQAVHNQGYATEAAHAVLGWSAAAGYERVLASVWEWNTASRRVLEKLGFVDSGQDGGPPSEHGRNIVTVRELT